MRDGDVPLNDHGRATDEGLATYRVVQFYVGKEIVRRTEEKKKGECFVNDPIHFHRFSVKVGESGRLSEKRRVKSEQ